MQAAQAGLVPLKAWLKGVLDEIVQVCLKQPDLEFAWVGDDAVDPLQQARALSLLVGAGIKTREEARAELALAPEPAVGPGMGGGGATVAKFNPYHDPGNGRFTTPDGAGAADAPIFPVADSGSGKYSVDLTQKEQRGGHAIDEHVNQTDKELLAEAAKPVFKSILGITVF